MVSKATTVRFTDEVYARLDQASARTGMPVNSIVVAACLEWMERHTPAHTTPAAQLNVPLSVMAPPPRWATLRRAVVEATAGRARSLDPVYPFARFTSAAQDMLIAAQTEAQQSGFNYIGTEHLLLASFADATSHSGITLAALGVHEPAVRAMLAKLLGAKKARVIPRIVPTSRVKKVIELGFQLCGAAGDPRVSTGHILLALSTEGEGMAARVLQDAGATSERIKSTLEAITEPEA